MGTSRGDAATSLSVRALVGHRQVDPTGDALGWR